MWLCGYMAMWLCGYYFHLGESPPPLNIPIAQISFGRSKIDQDHVGTILENFREFSWSETPSIKKQFLNVSHLTQYFA